MTLNQHGGHGGHSRTMKLLAASLATLIASASWSAGSSTPRKVATPPTLNLNGKSFKFKKIMPITVKLDGTVKKPMPYVPPETTLVQLPQLLGGASSPSPIIPAINGAFKLPPLLRFSLKVSWAGSIDTRLSPEWTSPGITIAEPKSLLMESMTDGEFKVLEALLLLQTPETNPLAVGLAHPLLKFSETREAAHEILGRSLLNLNIRTAAIEHFNQLLKTGKEAPRIKRALAFVLDSLKSNDYEEAQFLSPYVVKLNTADKDLANFPLALARVSLEQKELQKAWDTVVRVAPESPQSYEARFIQAMIYYRSNEVPSAQKELEELLKLADKMPKDLKSLSAATLAQIYFQRSQYKKAFDTYRLVDQEHPIWLETLVENAWSQILNKDYEGAAGNMFSLHTNYFKGAYKPESYIVRTVSYLQLCQFGDALAVLKVFLRKYKFAQKQLHAYKKQNPNHLEVVREFLRAGAPKKFAGLPRSLLVEIARDSKFIELQKVLNETEEDSTKLSQLTPKMDELDKQFQESQTKYTKQIQELDSDLKKADTPEKKASLVAERKLLDTRAKKFVLLRKIIQDAKLGVLAEEKSFTPIWANRKTTVKGQQNLVLQSSFQRLEKDLTHWLDQSELLFYEIHNGAGEHLRYQMASKDESRSPAAIKPEFKKDDKDMQWAFDGEIWEDEVGHYRSSLKSVCPDEAGTQLSEAGDKGLAPVAQGEDTN
jgi:tetratricopeptide (TPR) repeat protein